MPSLAGAYVRMFRAFERIAELTEEIYRHGAGLSAAADDAGHFADLDAVSTMITVLVGETAHGLAAALDHLVDQLAVLDSSRAQVGARFPICATALDFAVARRSSLAGLSDAHVEQIEALQPYRGVVWTALLAELAEPDRQRHLILAVPEADATAPFFASTESTRILAFDDGTPLVTTLGELARMVSLVLESFNPDFG